MLKVYYEDNNKVIVLEDLNEIEALISLNQRNFLIKVVNASEEELNFLTEKFQLHRVTIKDFSSKKHFPKIDEFGNYISTIMYDIELMEGDVCYESTQLNIILMDKITLIFSEADFKAFDEVYLRISKNPRNTFSDSCNLYYIILDVLVDNLFPILACFENKLDELEINILKEIDTDYTKKLINLRGNLLKLKKIFTYEEEVLFRISHDNYDLISEDTLEYLKDVFYHIEKLNTTLQEFNDWAGNLSDAYSNLSSSRLTSRLKILTIIQYIFLPLGFLTSWYSMIFDMPEAKAPHAYFIFITVIITIIIIMIIYFKKKKII